MAFAARFGALTEELVESLTQSLAQTNPDKFRSACDASLRKLRTHPYLRTNPFEVDSCLDGLDERFRVSHREALADALRQRLDALRRSPAKWHPEILYLLVELSDQPASKTRLSDLELPGQQVVQEPDAPPLRWEDVAREDGWDQDEELWKAVSYSSDDSAGQDDDHGSASASSDATSVARDGDSTARSAEDCIIHPDDHGTLNSIRQEQAWRIKDRPPASAPKIAVPEAQAVREVLFMFHGLECSLFNGAVSPSPAFQLADTAWETHESLMGALAESGRRLRVLRLFATQPQTIPHIQALQDCVARHLGQLDRMLAEIEARFASPKGEVVVSLMGLMGELAPRLEPLFALSSIIVQVRQARESDTFRYLELIFVETSEAQLTGKPGTFEFLARIFIECFNVYLRPIQRWMNEGKLIPGNELFFISESSSDVPLGDTWRSRFELRKTPDGRLHGPNFLQPAVSNIYNAGKNIVVLGLLGQHDAAASRHVDKEPLDYDSLCPRGFELAPFPDLFGAAFDRWIQSQYRKTSRTLKNALLGTWGLSTSLDALRTLYLMSEGRAASMLCEGLFARLDTMDEGWHGRYALTATGHEAFSSLLDTSRLSISVDSAGYRLPASQGRVSVRAALPSVRVHYRLPWPVRMIVTAESLALYQSIFTFLLQIRRAMHAMHKRKILDDYWTDRESWDERGLFYSMRHKLLWFYSTVQTYLATLVLEPIERQMRHDLEAAEDIDAMIAVHASAMKHIIEQACLGSRLAPIREGMLDVLDLAIKLEHGDGRGGADGLFLGVLRETAADFERHLRFICGGLRSVARASSSAHAAKWDILADMLQAGIGDGR
ncbi:spindle pole body component [Hirsutella rhossiliensis]|uniref:Spindle pole body component n=1 Tax=Hirsutella rhossiliensis TaxID=111463 RepID=A0A9P8MYX6_9HYPO|nr:spc97 / spc98 family domain-containing protein [Hirsutella rhossiliensis]KAH0964973.1 spc97 / spc98 family domain-containing protein [Hirsutella rhossiliensis]